MQHEQLLKEHRLLAGDHSSSQPNKQLLWNTKHCLKHNFVEDENHLGKGDGKLTSQWKSLGTVDTKKFID